MACQDQAKGLPHTSPGQHPTAIELSKMWLHTGSSPSPLPKGRGLGRGVHSLASRLIQWQWGNSPGSSSPIRRLIILQKLPPNMLAGIKTCDDRVHDSRRAVHNIERRMKTMIAHLALGQLYRVLIR